MIKIAWIMAIFNLYNSGLDWTILIFVILFAPYSNVMQWFKEMNINFMADRIVSDELKNTLTDEDK